MNVSKMKHLTRRFGIVAAGLAALAACGSAGGEVARMSVIEDLSARHGSASRGSPLYTAVDEAMPNVLYSIDGAAPVSVADAYVVGNVVEVVAGRSFLWAETADTEIRTEVPFNDPTAMVSTIHVTVGVNRSIVAASEPAAVHQALAPGRSVTLALALSAPVDVDAAAAELRALGTLATLLYHPSPVFDYDPSLWAVLEDGAFLGQVDAKGLVTFPVLTGEIAGAEGTSSQDMESPDSNEPVDAEATDQGYEQTG